MDFLEFFTSNLGENTLGAFLLASFFMILGIVLKGFLSNHGEISVAKINANVSLNEQAIKVMTAGMEVLKNENGGLKASLAQMEGHMDQIIEYILTMMKAETQKEADRAVMRLEQYLKSIGKWQY